jgi:hypothetical protein
MTSFDIPTSTPSMVDTMSSVQRSLGATPGHLLTPEDARFFNHLYSLNVPAADIATMMETMRAGREATNGMEQSASSGAVRVAPESVPSVAPPGYDFKG